MGWYVLVLSAAYVASVQSTGFAATAEQGPLYPVRPLLIKSYPGVENYQSDVYEVFQEPYPYNVENPRDLKETEHSVTQDLRSASAVALIQGEGESAVNGEVTFLQKHPPAGPVKVRGKINGLPPGKHGIHIHQAGDLRQGCEKLGGHFNPYLAQHGGPRDAIRHVGDLGNVEAKEDGTAELHFVDPLMSLVGGARSIVGRAVVITQQEDDLGRGGTADSVTTGSAGKPLACGVIAYIK